MVRITYSLLLKSGDLVVSGSTCSIVSGKEKLTQDLSLWLLERFGADRMHPTFGSTLQNYIGNVINSATQANVYNEVLRVLTNYQSMIYQLFSTNPSVFSLSELPYSIDQINVNITYDQVNVIVQVSNPSSTATVTISPSSL